MTVIFYTDKMIMAHGQIIVIVEHVKRLDKVHGAKDPLVVVRGKVNEYLGMNVDFTLKKGVAITQNDFIEKMWNGLSDEWKGNYIASLSAEFLFKVAANSEELTSKEKNECYAIIAKCLLTRQRYRIFFSREHAIIALV